MPPEFFQGDLLRLRAPARRCRIPGRLAAPSLEVGSLEEGLTRLRDKGDLVGREHLR